MADATLKQVASDKKTPAEEVAAALEGDFPRKGSSGSGTSSGWSVEARYAYSEPKMVAGALLDNRWRRLYFPEGQPGVPVASRYQLEIVREGLLSYEAAQALRWWFLANAGADGLGGTLCVETRLVEHSIKYTHESVALKAHAYIGGADRSSIMPSWGSKQASAQP